MTRRTCRECGCDDLNPCSDLFGMPCRRAEPDLCSACVDAEIDEGRNDEGRDDEARDGDAPDDEEAWVA